MESIPRSNRDIQRYIDRDFFIYGAQPYKGKAQSYKAKNTNIQPYKSPTKTTIYG